ncbi:hypothetical protein THMA_0346 [Thermotoga maritima MSB8]|uniref:Uncharacterized protein n=1 Tax=Thermotoga maritima (strain ATCC 43589 / DSM 3109 / JCM 10099 / NBRC 100826 / MSB8) TaxID=243274 RepID=Q9WYH3_THEMA|nr:hypothetical protein TM_0338 [Thermotoga maritima MSB8]AHD17899.1 hypothetical protein THEMA_03025 [Thermotoga maritima MSB8]AKE26273.1 hypothetical protein THMC_0346 [Thermotoga maritima]AKE28136.1 hypothetical protein THMA_0346 [Thermotoga maritima MSB8]AKE30010.1 hypothetical protein THMB_0346 [Thermotoga maritima]
MRIILKKEVRKMFVLIPVDVLIAIHSEKIGQKRNR